MIFHHVVQFAKNIKENWSITLPYSTDFLNQVRIFALKSFDLFFSLYLISRQDWVTNEITPEELAQN